MGPLLSLLVLAATAAPPTIALPGLNGVRLSAGEAELYAEVLSVELSQLGLKVITSRDISHVLGVERQEALLGCGDTSTCVIEMIGAMGVDAVLVGDIGQLGEQFVLNFKVLSTRDGSAIALYNSRAANLQAMPDELTRAALDIAKQVAAALKRDDLVALIKSKEPAPAPPPSPDRRLWAVAPAVIGVAAAVVGVVFELQARSALAALEAATTPEEATAAAGRGRLFEPTGWALVGVGAAALVAAGALFLFGRPAVAPVAFFGPGGAAFGVSGALP